MVENNIQNEETRDKDADGDSSQVLSKITGIGT